MTTKILFAGGGTAGHVEPALAVANWLRNEKPNWEYVFVGTKKGLENQLVPAAGFELLHISKVVLPRQFTPESFVLPIRILTATWQAIKICKKVDFASQIFIAFSRAGQKLGRWRNAKLSGMPIRTEIIASANLSGEEAKAKKRLQIEKWKLDQDKPTILVFGGSQGSRHINEAILQSLSAFTEKGVQVVHSVGRDNPLPTSTENYLPLPYIEDMSSAYHAADLVIARSGALTCAELAAVGKFAILIPLPIGNGEQAVNASDLQAAGAAEVVDDNKFNSDWLSSNWDEIWRKARNYQATPSAQLSASETIGSEIIRAIDGRK